MGYSRESPRGSQNLVSPGARTFVPGPVCDDTYTLSALFGSPVPDRCRTGPVSGCFLYRYDPDRYTGMIRTGSGAALYIKNIIFEKFCVPF